MSGVRISLALRVIIYFTRNPEEVLCTSDVAAKFQVPSSRVTKGLEAARANGLVHAVPAVDKAYIGNGNSLVWSIGPKLKDAIERNQW